MTNGDIRVLLDGLPKDELYQTRILIFDMGTDPFTFDLDRKKPLVDRLGIVEPEQGQGKDE